MKILIYDIETAPKLAYVWGVWKQDIPPKMLIEHGHMLSWSAKWLGEEQIMSDTLLNHKNSTKYEHVLAKGIYNLMEEADAIVTYNGNKFDIPIVNTIFLRADMAPPLPSKSIDLYPLVKSRFRFTSNKLASICERLGLGKKFNHEGFELWEKCMRGDPEAWDRMRMYNERDVVLTERLYLKLRPWIRNHPNVNIMDGSYKVRCAVCGSENMKKNGIEYLTAGAYQRYKCNDCGANNRGTTIQNPIDKRRSLTRSL